MFSSILFATVLAAVAVRADPNPSEPGPGSVYNEGSTCHIAWDADTTGVWQVMNIELMSGSNTDMNHITTVATVDGTNAANATLDIPCPEVTPNSAIYFYQFTSPSSTLTYWTTRFAIADANGKTTDPANADQPNGNGDPAIPWGVGALVDPSQAVPAPEKGTNVSSSAAPTSGTASSSALGGSSASVAGSSAAGTSSSVGSVTVTSSGASSSKTVVPTSSASANTNATSGNATTGASAANGAAAVSFDSRLTQTVATLGVVAAAFAVLF